MVSRFGISMCACMLPCTLLSVSDVCMLQVNAMAMPCRFDVLLKRCAPLSGHARCAMSGGAVEGVHAAP